MSQHSLKLSVANGYSRYALVALIVANVMPLFGVVFFDWSAFLVMLLYWFENGITGLFNVPKILLAGRYAPGMPAIGVRRSSGSGTPLERVLVRIPNLFLSAFFCVHYGFFWFVHGVFVFELFGNERGFSMIGGPSPFDRAMSALTSDSVLLICAVGLFVSHGVSFFLNYIGRREFAGSQCVTQMFKPYARVVVLHMALIAAGFIVMLLGSSAWVLVPFVLFKLGLDVASHLVEHALLGGGEGAKGFSFIRRDTAMEQETEEWE